MQTISAQQFKSKYGDQALNQFQPTQQSAQPGFIQGVGQDIQNRANNLKPSIDNLGNGNFSNVPELALNVAGQGAGVALDTIGRGMSAIAPETTKAVGELGGQLLHNLGTTSAGKAATALTGQMQQTHPQLARDLSSAGTLAMAAPAIEGIGATGDLATQFGKKALTGANDLASSAVNGAVDTIQSAGEKIQQSNIPSNIMNKVARLNPQDEIKFTKVAGKSPGQYLTDTGNFGSPQDIVANEAKKFMESKNMVDTELGKLPGEYQVGAVNDALNMLIEKGGKVSSSNVPARFLQVAQDLLTKSETQGLNMSEINVVKRLAERELKLGYNKMMNPDLIQKATNIDSTIRDWQFKKADYLGFKNISEMNKQTQISKFLVDKLGDKLVSQQVLKNMTLTDWIMLSGGNTTAVSGFLTKKFFSSKAVQSKIAEMLSGGGKQGMITPQRDFNPEYLNPQKALPVGTKIPGKYPVDNGVITPVAPTTYEAQAPSKANKK